MRKFKVSTKATVRIMLDRLDRIESLSPLEMEQANCALEKLGIPHLVDRFAAQKYKEALKAVTQI